MIAGVEFQHKNTTLEECENLSLVIAQYVEYTECEIQYYGDGH